MTKFRAPSKIYFYDILNDRIIEYLYDCRYTWYHYLDENGEVITVSEDQIFFKDNIPDNDYLRDCSDDVYFTKKETCIRFKKICLGFYLRNIQIKILNLSTEAQTYSDRLKQIEQEESK